MKAYARDRHVGTEKAMSKSNAVRGVFVGLATIDLVYDVEDFPAADTKIEAKSQQVYAGGPATNAAVTFRHLGGEAALVAAVGRHALAGVVRVELDRYGVRLCDLQPEFDGVPSISSVAVDRKGRRTVVSANAARIGAATVAPDLALCDWADVVEVDGHQMRACQQWAEVARARGVHVVLDGGSWKQGTDELLKFVDTAICSADFHPPGCRDEDETLAYLAACGVGQRAITHGAGPVRWQCGADAGARCAESGLMATPQVAAVDTMGAGDIFHGAFCCAWAQGRGFVTALAEAARIASDSCRFHGTREWMAERD
jgi:sugar/nucleoside kinase (ribokinase family)